MFCLCDDEMMTFADIVYLRSQIVCRRMKAISKTVNVICNSNKIETERASGKNSDN